MTSMEMREFIKKRAWFHGNETAYKNEHEVMGTETAFPWILVVIAH